MSEPVIYYFTGGKKLNQYFYFHQSLFVHEYLNVSWRTDCEDFVSSNAELCVTALYNPFVF